MRVPEATPPELATVADEAFGRMVSIFRGSRHRYQGVQLAAARAVREEICGPLTQKLAVSGLDNLTDEQLEARLVAIAGQKAAEPTAEAAVDP